MFAQLKAYTDHVGPVYGTEDFSVYVYSLIKMTRPNHVLELGTGLGIVACWAAQALKENQQGQLITVDNGQSWENHAALSNLLGNRYAYSYDSFVEKLIKEFDLGSYFNFVKSDIEEFQFDRTYDMVFCDHAHSAFSVTSSLARLLPHMSMTGMLWIHSASTYYESYLTLEHIVTQLNQKRIPLTLREMINPGQLIQVMSLVEHCRFELSHIVENKQRAQNSAAQIRMVPVDVVAHPRVNIRFSH